ncbi:MAG TPA: hypothetical protein VN789_12305 [Casimicrobiaceae bacterium]|nr:hypothetical protein [Casimicrobiaceae bacterium]
MSATGNAIEKAADKNKPK